MIKNPAANARDVGSILEVRKIPWRKDLPSRDSSGTLL